MTASSSICRLAATPPVSALQVDPVFPMAMDLALALVPLDDTTFMAPVIRTDERRVFGGLLLGQALAAASRTVMSGSCNSLHAMFSAAARVDEPLEIKVAPLRDGRSFAARRIEAWQGNRLILAAFASFHAGDAGPEHAITMPVVPSPEELSDQRELRAGNALKRGQAPRRYVSELLLDTRIAIESVNHATGVEGYRALWFRPRAMKDSFTAARRAALALASDMGLVHVGLQPHDAPIDGVELECASLDHAIWFHRDPPTKDWLLHVQWSPIAAHGRGFSRGSIFTRDGVLVASTAQEILMRRPHQARDA